METTLLIITLIISALALITTAILLVVLLKKGKSKEDVASSIQATEQIKGSIESLKETIPLQVQNSVSEQMVNINKNISEQMIHVNEQLASNAETSNQRLNTFQNTINENLNNNIKSLNEKVDANLKDINGKVDKSLSEGFKGTSESMEKLQKALGEIGTAQKNIESLSGEVVSLKDILSNNQSRGRYGEMQLEMMLANLFGESNKGLLYEAQYIIQKASADKEELKPDAVIFLDGSEHKQMICIDSKFSIVGYETLFDSSKELSDSEKASLKNQFKGALKLRINETSKYVIKSLTVNNAIMFIPNDGIFAFVENEFPDLVNDARTKGVVLASPTIIQPLIVAFRAVQIDSAKSKNIAKINEALVSLGTEFSRFIIRWDKIEKNMGTLSKSTEDFGKSVKKINNRFDRIQSADFAKGIAEQPEEEESQPSIEFEPDGDTEDDK